MEYTKQPITLAEQINILKQRGLVFENEEQAIAVLNHVSYFRLASYVPTMPGFGMQHFAVRPKITSRMRQRWITNFNFPIDRLYPQLCCIAYWLNSINPQNTFVQDFKSLLTKYPSVQPSRMGFPRGWESEPLWQ